MVSGVESYIIYGKVKGIYSIVKGFQSYIIYGKGLGHTSSLARGWVISNLW